MQALMKWLLPMVMVPRAQRADVVELVAQVLLERPRLLDGLEVDAPGGRQADGARAAVEERHAERSFELADCDAQGGLGDEERLSCLGIALLPVDFIDVAHLLLHDDSLFLDVSVSIIISDLWSCKIYKLEEILELRYAISNESDTSTVWRGELA